jgi:hypothetical protein
MLHARSVRLLAAVPVLALLAGPAAAQVQSKCLVGKNKCMAKKASSLLKCEQLAETPGKDPDPNANDCVDKARDKFEGGSTPAQGCFEKLETKVPNDCVTSDDTSAAEAAVDACVANIVAAIDPPPLTQSKCNVGKKKCATKTLTSLLKCWQKAQTPGQPTDPNTKDCVTKAMAKFDGGADSAMGCFVKLEAKPGNDCVAPLGNTAAVEAVVNQCVTDLMALVTTPTTTTTTTTSTTTTTLGVVSFATNVQPLFDGNCTGCHSGPFPSAGLNLSAASSYGALVNVLSSECTSTKLVAPGDSASSYLVHKLLGTGPCYVGVRMPFGGTPFTASEMLIVTTWIDQGAANN